MQIRTATLADAEELRDYAIRLFAEGLPGIFKRPDPTLDEERSFIRSRLEPDNSTLLVAVVEERIAGLIEFVGGALEEERHTGTFALSVASEYRGQGIGTALVEALIAWAPSVGVSRIQAWAWANNPGSIALYERLGFEREGLCRHAIVSDGKPVDVVLLARAPRAPTVDRPVSREVKPTWHQRHVEGRTFGQKLADGTAHVLGSWPFIVVQTVIVGLWITLNVAAVVRRWDPYPFILLNLMFSVQAAYAAPIIMMSQNRQAERDRYQAQADYDTNTKAECEVEEVLSRLSSLENALRRIERTVSQGR